MNEQVLSNVIKFLRVKNKITQSELANKLNVSDKTISKWETGKGCPDISMLDEIAKAFNISLIELMSGSIENNSNISSNMLKSKFYVCPICGNVLYSVGDAVISCHGIKLKPLGEIKSDGNDIKVETVEDEYYITANSPMLKSDYISFIAAVSTDRVQIVKLYPEGLAAVRFKKYCVKKVVYYSNKDGLKYINI